MEKITIRKIEDIYSTSLTLFQQLIYDFSIWGGSCISSITTMSTQILSLSLWLPKYTFGVYAGSSPIKVSPIFVTPTEAYYLGPVPGHWP